MPPSLALSRQPQYPLDPNADWLWAFNAPTFYGHTSSRGYQFTLQGGNDWRARYLRATGPHGVALLSKDFYGGDSGVLVENRAADMLPRAQGTVLIVSRTVALVTYERLLSATNFELSRSESSTFQIGVGGSNYDTGVSYNTLFDDTPVAVEWGAFGRRLWKGGILLASSSSAPGASAISGNTSIAPLVGERLTWLIAASEKLFDCSDLSVNPWQIYRRQTARIYSFPSGAIGTTVSVPAGSLTLTGNAPTVVTTANQTIAVPSGTLTLTGNNPTVIASDHKTIAVPVGTLTLTGNAPTVTVSGAGSVTVSVPSGTLTLGGLAPTVIATGNITVEIPAGSLSLTGYAPTVLTPRLVSVPTGTLTLTGNNPTVITTSNQVLSIPSGTLTLTGFAPTVIGEVVSSNKGGISGWTESDYKLRQRLRKQALAQAALEDDEEALAILLATLLRR